MIKYKHISQPPSIAQIVLFRGCTATGQYYYRIGAFINAVRNVDAKTKEIYWIVEYQWSGETYRELLDEYCNLLNKKHT